MFCRTARRAILRRGFTAIPSLLDRRLSRHLASCEACAAEARREDELTRLLSTLRGMPPVEVDVTRRVMERIESLGAVGRVEVPARQLGWASAAAGLAALVLLGAGLRAAPALFEFLLSHSGALPDAIVFLARGFAPAADLVAGAQVLARAALDVLSAFAVLVQKAEPLARGAAALAVIGMAMTTAVVVARDFLRPVAVVNREDP